MNDNTINLLVISGGVYRLIADVGEYLVRFLTGGLARGVIKFKHVPLYRASRGHVGPLIWDTQSKFCKYIVV